MFASLWPNRDLLYCLWVGSAWQAFCLFAPGHKEPRVPRKQLQPIIQWILAMTPDESLQFWGPGCLTLQSQELWRQEYNVPQWLLGVIVSRANSVFTLCFSNHAFIFWGTSCPNIFGVFYSAHTQISEG